MTMYMTRAPMNKGELDRHLNAMGWRRQGNEAQQKDDASAFIHDIDKVPAASGRMHILMEAKTSAAQSVA